MTLGARLAALAKDVGADVKALFTGKVDKVEGKTLSANDFTDEDKSALSRLVDGEEQVQQTLLDLQRQINELKGS